MNISLSDNLKAYVDQQVDARGLGTRSEYMLQLIRKDQDVQCLRDLLLDGARSAPSAPVDADYFVDLRKRVTQRNVS